MKILLDENLPIKLKYHLIGYDIYTVRDMNWDGYKNGHLLNAMVETGVSVLITTDKNLEYQHNIRDSGISLIVLDVLLLKWEYIEPLIEKIHHTLTLIEIGKIYIVQG